MKLLILDRDGVINHNSDQYIKNPDEWRPLPGSLEAIAQLTQSGWRIAVATNQSGIARGLFSMETLNAMHAKMHKAVMQAGGRIEAIFYCPDSPDSNSPSRKPNPGMLLSISERFNTPLHGVPMVGDSLRDLQAAHAVGALPFLVLSGNGRKTRKKGGMPAGTQTFPDLAAVTLELLR